MVDDESCITFLNAVFLFMTLTIPVSVSHDPVSVSPSSMKAHLERGRDLDLALRDLSAALHLSPSEKLIASLHTKCIDALRESDKRDKAKFFGKII